ncbi:MAG: hypothetical protein JNL05_07090 [Flavobacteriales bacterium]|nr:hypothetical protein [Flavobacteriales bacterium]
MLLSAGHALTGHAALQQQLTLADVHDSLLHAEIAALGAYPELEGVLPVVELNEVPLRACSSTSAELEGEDVRVELRNGPQGLAMRVVVDGTQLAFTDDRNAQFRSEAFCGWDAGLQRVLPYCGAYRSQDGDRVYVFLIAGEGRKQRLATWVFEDGRYLFRVEEEAVL